ncbi:Protein PTCD3, mitochondrial [Chionoecetes opilio]|uniref:Protein PTCD3, mitochondrial n=1 Tax=Chionoecetes opilio TaxID=41210 RepID=A0A8J5CJG2_CHIOP|nr:Protein PTCD3, mitochondrial [Chionoecetes opilio]
MGTAATQDTIDVPRRIQRSHTDILKALASTVGVDTTGPHYKYSDDPYLAPHSNLTKRSYALSKEAGRKAARWVREEHPKLFSHRPEDPFVQGQSDARVAPSPYQHFIIPPYCLVLGEATTPEAVTNPRLTPGTHSLLGGQGLGS